MLKEVLNHIERRNRFLLTSHARPDGDAVGSALACCQILRSMGKQADVVLHDGVPRIYQPLPFANVNWIDPKAVATAEMVYRLAREAGVKISPEIATCLYTAVLTDTGSFMFKGTNEHTFALARELVLAGADPAHCARSVYFGHSTAKMRLLGAALSNLHREGPLAWIWVTRDQMERFAAKEEDCEGLVNYALSIQDVEVAIFFRELPDSRYRVSLRSKGQLDVAAVAEQFGGGGHACASGCSLDGPLSVAVARIMAQLRTNPSVQ
jgi:bifunctional oligoribonuclease and PAP phosphatase NrnA